MGVTFLTNEDKTELEQKIANSSSDKDFIVSFTIINEDMRCTSDKTFEEVQAAIQDGYNLYGTTETIHDGELINAKLPLSFFNDVCCTFSSIAGNQSCYIDFFQNGECLANIIAFAANDLSYVSDEAFLDKLNAVLPDGDEVSY